MTLTNGEINEKRAGGAFASGQNNGFIFQLSPTILTIVLWKDSFFFLHPTDVKWRWDECNKSDKFFVTYNAYNFFRSFSLNANHKKVAYSVGGWCSNFITLTSTTSAMEPSERHIHKYKYYDIPVVCFCLLLCKAKLRLVSTLGLPDIKQYDMCAR